MSVKDLSKDGYILTLPRMWHKKRSFIDWSKIIVKDNINPFKFDTKKEAIVKAKKLINTNIDRVMFHFDTAWVIFHTDNYLGKDNQYHLCKPETEGLKLERVYDRHNYEYTYYWEKEDAIDAIPLYDRANLPVRNGKPIISMQVYSNSGSLIFGRHF